jgi:protein TonB
LLSTFIHAGLVAGLMYGLSQDTATDLGETEIEPIFFEILEESVINPASTTKVSEGPVPTKEGSVPLFSEGPVPMAMPVSASGTEPPSIEYSSDMVDEGPVPLPSPLPPAAKMPVDSVEGPVPTRDETLPIDTTSPRKAEGPVPTKEGPVPTADSAPQEQSEIDSEPRALNRIVPVYPRSARRRGREGVVTLEILVSDTGNVSEAVIVAGSGHKDLDSAAVSAVRSARFAPATEDGVQVQGKLRLTFEFKLK